MSDKVLRKRKIQRLDKVELCLGFMSVLTVVYYGCYVFTIA